MFGTIAPTDYNGINPRLFKSGGRSRITGQNSQRSQSDRVLAHGLPPSLLPTKVLVALHGGVLDLQSEVSVGTSVTVRFPVERILAPLEN